MAQPQSLLVRLLDTPNLPEIVPHLPPEVLHGVIQHIGLEDCAEFVALATPAQLGRVLDADVWRASAPGVDDEFNADRFGLWLDVLMQSGAAVAVEKLAGLDVDLVITGISRHAKVFDQAVVSQHITLEGELAGGRELEGERVAEIGGFVLEAKRTSAWDAITEILGALESLEPTLFHRVMYGCVDLSSPPPEKSGFHDLLDDDDQHMFDAAADREARRDSLGYLAPAQARAFLQSARELRLDGTPPAASPIARAYFRAVDVTAEARRESAGDLPDSRAGSPLTGDAEAIAGVVELLREAGVLTPEPRALLTAGDGRPARLASVEAYLESHEDCAAELAYLANSLIAGCSIDERSFTVQEAADAVMATCNLGLENWPAQWADRDLVTAFQAGWSILHRDVCAFAATRLVDISAAVQAPDRTVQLRLSGLRRALRHQLREGTPWRARGALDVILMIDASSWVGLCGLIDECPVVHGAVTAPRHSGHTIKSSDFEFIARKSEIDVVHAFIESLPSALSR